MMKKTIGYMAKRKNSLVWYIAPRAVDVWEDLQDFEERTSDKKLTRRELRKLNWKVVKVEIQEVEKK